MKRRTVFILAACVAVVALGTALLGALALVMRHGRKGESSLWSSSSAQYLDLRLDGDIPEQPPTSVFFERHPPSLRTIISSIDRAGSDASIKALVVHVGSLSGGWGKAKELRDAIVRFRKSGKPAYAHIESCGNKEYYLATACSKVYVIPTAILDITGLAAEVMFFRKTLDKLGVEAQFEGIGKYKNAPNQFTESGFTAPHREQMEALVDSLFAEYVGAVAESRGKKPAEVRQWIDDGPYVATAAKKAGLVDDLIYQDELTEKLGKATRITPAKYVKSLQGYGFRSHPKLALIYVVGEISSGESQHGGLGGGDVAGSDTVAAAIRTAREDDDVKAIVLRVDSPGGSGTASDVMWREVQLATDQKPVITSMGDVAASGGYYISMGTQAIVAEPTTITGSIGVFSGKFSMRGLYEKIGVTEEIVARGRNADLFSAYRPWTQDERTKMHDLSAAFYEEFVRKAATGRGRTRDQIHEVAQGRVWTGREAVTAGLVDKLGGLREAIDLAKEKAKIGKDDEVELMVLPERKGFLETLLEDDEGMMESRLGARLPSEIQALTRWAASMRDGFPSARLPFDVRIR
jgi:protease IV